MSSAFSIRTFQKVVATATTRVQLETTATKYCQNMIVKALKGNTGKIYVGDATVAAATGFELSAGDSVSLSDILLGNSRQEFDPTLFWIDASVNGDGVSVIMDTKVTVAD